MMEACCSRFTAAEGGARLAAAAANKNILAVEYASFIPVRLLYEKAYQIRGSLSGGSKRSVYITRASRVQVVAYELKILTDLGTVAAEAYEDVCDWTTDLETKEVLICTSSVLKQVLEEQLLTMSNINVLIVDSCHLIYTDGALKYIMHSYKQCPKPDQPLILALTYPLFTSTKKNIEIDTEKETVREEEMGVYKNVDDFDMYEKLEWKIEELESELCCQMDLAEDIDGGKRISSSVTKPRELIIEYGSRPSDEELPEDYRNLEKYMKDTVQDALDFIEDHRHDPTEIYGEELYDEFMNIPDPTLDPKEIFKQFLYILEQLGPYAADKAAFSLLTKLEKLKIKIPYERHFILMCLCTTVFIKIRCYSDLLFSKYEDEWERIKTFSSSKIMRFAEILEKFKPPDIRNQNTTLSRLDSTLSSQDTRDIKEDSGDNETGSVVSGCDSLSKSDSTKKMLNDIDECDFTTLGNKIEDKVNTYCSNLREIFDSPTEPFRNSTLDDKDSQNILSQTNIPNDNTKITSSNDTSNSNKPNIPSNSSTIETGKTDITTTVTPPNTHHISGLNIHVSEMDTKNNTITNSPDTRPNATHDIISTSDLSGSVQLSGMDIKGNEIMVQRGLLGFPRRAGHRLRGRTRMQRNNAARVLQMQQNPDALCGIVFMKDALIAKIMFMMIVDMSRCNRRLGYLCVQYCATENPADPGTEPRECQRQGKKQEEVLKKFRMHECNLLLATSALEEGIDLPRCNLVLRWDVPVSYRSYGLCRGRARAARATAALLCSNNPDTTQMLLHNVATYRELDQIISRKCGCGIQDEPPQSEEDHADSFTSIIKPYSPNDSDNYINPSKNITVKEYQISSKNDEDSKINKGHEKSVKRSKTSEQDSVKNCKIGEENVNSDKMPTESADHLKNLIIDDLKIDNYDVTNNREIEKGSIRKDGIDSKNICEEKAAYTNICKGNTNSDNDFSKNINEEISSNKVLIDNSNINEGNNNKIGDELAEFDSENGNIPIINNMCEAQKIFVNTLNLNANLDKIDTINYKNIDLHNQIVDKTAKININNEDDIENKNRQFNHIETTNISEIHDQNKLKTEQNDIDMLSEQNIEKTHEPNCKNENNKINEAKIHVSWNDTHNIRDQSNKEGVRNIPNDSAVNTSDSGLSKDDINSKVYCNKCYNVKVNNVCLCSNVNLYYQLLAKPNLSDSDTKKNISECDTATVDLSTAIALINRYCGKLPSDTFTRLVPQWWMEEVPLLVPGSGETRTAYICTLRLPLNCPIKYNIVGHPMPTKVLARRMVALQACRILHKSGELDNQLMPIGKENFKVAELEACNSMTTYNSTEPHDCARPGTTKRRQYYYKRTAWAFTDCQPIIDTSDTEINPDADPDTMDIDSDIEAPINECTKTKESCKQKEIKPKDNAGTKRNMLYAIVSKLWCALPERYNTRGRRLHAPQNASQAIGILMSRDVSDNLQIPAFPVYTRSGEVRVSVEHIPDADVRMSPRRGRLVRRFMRFVFAEVLRVRRRGMRLHTHTHTNTHNNYYIVPTNKVLQDNGTFKIDIDWSFLELIYQHTEDKKQTDIEKPLIWQETEDEQKIERDSNRRRRGKKRMGNPLLKKGECFVFDSEKYKEAVVTPWYRNQDQPQFFLVAEICWNLSPDSSFPSATHQSFRDYYSTKYGVTLTQRDQPLLDVDHTSARLNLLTPRYVNRKGVALPVSSERTRRAKRDRLDQKQILIPELCRVHPFAAPLWFATVALPCVLYRINALLIADEIRRAVAIDVGLGIPKINEDTMPGFQWPALDFGWSLAEVLSADSEKKKEDDESKKETEKESSPKEDKEEELDEEQKDTEEQQTEVKEKTINDILQEKQDADAEAAFEIGTWSNDMASCIPETLEYDELMEPLPPNLTFCTSASGSTNWCDPIGKPKFSQFNPSKNFSMADSDDSYMSSDLDSDDTDLDFDGSDEDTDTSGFCSNRNTNAAMGVRIEYKTAHEAEAFDLDCTKKVNPAPIPDEQDDLEDKVEHDRVIRQGSAPEQHIAKFRDSVSRHKEDIIRRGHLITKEEHITEVLPETKDSFNNTAILTRSENEAMNELFPFGSKELLVKNGQIDIKSIEKNKRLILEEIRNSLPKDDIKKLNCFSMKDIDIDATDYVNEKVVNVGFDAKEGYEEVCRRDREFIPYYEEGKSGEEFDFDHQPVLEGHPGPSPSVILQALTMSNANDGINLERLETIGDSFLKFAITAYLYCAHPTVHEGKLSHMRSKQVSNLNLYRLGRNKRLGARMIASKFEPHDNWLPPCHKPPPTLHPRINGEGKDIMQHLDTPLDAAGCFIPYNLITQHSIPDKSIADCVEALIGAYLLECGPRGALLFMSWLGIRVLPCHHVSLPDSHPYVRRMEKIERDQKTSATSSTERQRSNSSSSSCSEESSAQEVFPEEDWSWPGRAVGSLQPYKDPHGKWMQPIFGALKAPPSPLLRYIEDPDGELEMMLSGYDTLERTLQYRFKDRSLLLQALTHASHHSNRLTDCYQRLEFLGDAILDYLITRHLYEDPRRHSPGALTDLRSALVNNTIFATLAARHGFHKYFRHMSPGLNEVLTKYVKIQEENGHSISEEHYLIQEDEMEQAEDVEVPKALGDLFESVAGAIFLDSGMSLGAVWKSYVNLMGAELEAFSAAAPKSPVRELLEAEPDTAKFGKPERLADGRRVRVCVEVFGRGTFKGVGRNYRIAKGTAARCALRHLKVHRAR